MRTWTLPISRPLLPEDLVRARALARWRWGASADVVAYEGGLLTFLGPEADWIGDEFRRCVERGEGVAQAPGTRTTRGKRRR